MALALFAGIIVGIFLALVLWDYLSRRDRD